MTYSVNVCKTHYEQVVLTKKQGIDVSIKCLCDIYDIPKYYIIKDDKLYAVVEYHTSHSWEEEEFVRVLTEEDKHALTVLQRLIYESRIS